MANYYYWKCTFTTIKGEEREVFTQVSQTEEKFTEEQANDFFYSMLLVENLQKGKRVDAEEFYIEELDELAHRRFLKGLTPEQKLSASKLKKKNGGAF